MIAHAGFKDHGAVSQVPERSVGLSDPTAPRPGVNVFALHSPIATCSDPTAPRPGVDGVARRHSADSGSSGRCAMGT